MSFAVWQNDARYSLDVRSPILALALALALVN